MSDQSANSKAEAKIHILYLVDKVPGVTYHQLMDSCMKSLFVEFFDFADAYEELIAGNLMDRGSSAPGQEDSLGKTDILTLTEGGKAILSDLKDSINDKLRLTLDSIASELKAEFDISSRTTASVNMANGKIEVILGYTGDDKTVSLTVTADSREQADSIIRKWKSGSADYTEGFVSQLLSNS